MLGMTIADLRAQHALTQAELAERAGVSRPLITMIERGSRVLTARIAMRLVAGLGVPPEERAGVVGELVIAHSARDVGGS